MTSATKTDVGQVRWSWDQVAVYLGLYVGAIGVLWTDDLIYGLQVLVVTFLVRMLAISVFYHRYFAHKSFEAGRVIQFLMGLLGVSTMQRGPIWWAATHRTHHQNADTERDLHSPAHHGFIYSHFGWFLDQRNREVDFSRVRDLLKYPELRVLDKPWAYSTIVLGFGWGLYALGGYDALIWGFFVSAICNMQVTHWIQSFSHSWRGYRRYATQDSSRNHFLLGIISLGEYHNNHHRFPSSARQGATWWELDVGFLFLRVLSAMGLVRNLRDLHPRPSAESVVHTQSR